MIFGRWWGQTELLFLGNLRLPHHLNFFRLQFLQNETWSKMSSRKNYLHFNITEFFTVWFLYFWVLLNVRAFYNEEWFCDTLQKWKIKWWNVILTWMLLVRNSIKNQKRGLTVILLLRRGHRRQWLASSWFFFIFYLFNFCN